MNPRSADDLNALELAKTSIDIQLRGITALRDSLGREFERALELLLAVKGRVVVTGMGKSGHIGRKIAATMASVGTPAFFVHPGEASHGDLGMISQNDVVIAISNSGETRELTDTLRYCARFDIPLIAITSQADSSLANLAAVCLTLPQAEEACPLDKAPTTSTSMTLVLGDALALVLLQLKGFTPEDFGNFHPGGKLGAQLLRVQQIIDKTVGPLPLASETTSLHDLMLTMTSGRKGCVGVLDDQGRLNGIVTDGDLRRTFQQSQDLERPARELMSQSPKTIGGQDLAADALAEMQRNKISVLFVVDEAQRPIGIVHLQDLMQFGVV